MQANRGAAGEPSRHSQVPAGRCSARGGLRPALTMQHSGGRIPEPIALGCIFPSHGDSDRLAARQIIQQQSHRLLVSIVLPQKVLLHFFRTQFKFVSTGIPGFSSQLLCSCPSRAPVSLQLPARNRQLREH